MNTSSPSASHWGFYFTILAFLGILLLVFLKSNRYFNPSISIESINGIKQLKISASEGHHYRIAGSINGVAVNFLLDTGASSMAVNEKIAEQAGLKRGGYGTMQTANGSVEARISSIARLEIGPIVMKDIPVWIMPNMDDEVLLGMDILRQFHWKQENGALLIELPE